MRKIPYKTIMWVCLGLALLVAARSAVTVGKAFYYRTDWVAELVEDPWFIVGLVAAAVGMLALLVQLFQRKEPKPETGEETVEEFAEAVAEIANEESPEHLPAEEDATEEA